MVSIECGVLGCMVSIECGVLGRRFLLNVEYLVIWFLSNVEYLVVGFYRMLTKEPNDRLQKNSNLNPFKTFRNKIMFLHNVCQTK